MRKKSLKKIHTTATRAMSVSSTAGDNTILRQVIYTRLLLEDMGLHRKDISSSINKATQALSEVEYGFSRTVESIRSME